MTINGANFTVTADTLCNDGSVEKYFTGGAPSGWSLGALGVGGGATREAIMTALGVDVSPSPTGTTYYLDNTHGSASDSNDGLTPSTPWLTLNKALTTLTAGDMVIGTGTYTHGADITPTNSGTAGNPIIYRAATPRGFIIDQQNNYDGFRLTSGSINYLVIDGLEIRNTYGSDGGGGVFTKDNNQSIHVFNCYIHDVDCNSGGNAGGIRFDSQSDGVAFNNIIHDVTVGGVANNNAAGIHGYGQDGAITAFNKIYNTNHGIDCKNSRAVTDLKIFGNDIDVTSNAIYINVIGAGQNPSNITNTDIYNNLFRDGNIAVECDEHIPQSSGFLFHNNVLLTDGIFLDTISGVELYNNIFNFAGGALEAQVTITTELHDRGSGAGDTMSITYSDYNNFPSAPTFTTNRYAHTGGSAVSAMSLATWQAQSSGDGFDTIQYDSPDSNSLTVSPSFDSDYIAGNVALSGSGRNGGNIGLEYAAGADWSVA